MCQEKDEEDSISGGVGSCGGKGCRHGLEEGRIERGENGGKKDDQEEEEEEEGCWWCKIDHFASELLGSRKGEFFHAASSNFSSDPITKIPTWSRPPMSSNVRSWDISKVDNIGPHNDHGILHRAQCPTGFDSDVDKHTTG